MLCTPHQIIILVIKSTRLRLAEHVARMEERRGAYRVLVGKAEGRRPPGKPSGTGDHGVDRSGSGWGQVAGSCQCGNERSGSIKCEDFVKQLKSC